MGLVRGVTPYSCAHKCLARITGPVWGLVGLISTIGLVVLCTPFAFIYSRFDREGGERFNRAGLCLCKSSSIQPVMTRELYDVIVIPEGSSSHGKSSFLQKAWTFVLVYGHISIWGVLGAPCCTFFACCPEEHDPAVTCSFDWLARRQEAGAVVHM